MSETLTDDVNRYYDEVRMYLDCPKDEQDRLLFDINRRLLELQADIPTLDYDDIVDFLGNPRDLAYQFTDSIDSKIILSYHRKRSYLRIARIVCIIAVITVLFTSMLYTNQLKSDIHVVRTDSFSYLN